MKTNCKSSRVALGAALLFAVGQASSAFGCAACYGQSDSAMAQGMNWGIMVLLVVVSVVLSGVAGFFVYLSKRNRKP